MMLVMKNPLHYQTTEYDCGPTSVINGITYLFERKVIPPDIPRNIMLYCLDQYDDTGARGKHGTSAVAMAFIGHWLTEYGKYCELNVSAKYIGGPDVTADKFGTLFSAVRNNGVAVVRVIDVCGHYVLITKVTDELVYMFDPYYEEGEFPEDICVVSDHPCEYNRIVPMHYFRSESEEALYSFGEPAKREALLIFNKETQLTEENTIEYFI